MALLFAYSHDGPINPAASAHPLVDFDPLGIAQAGSAGSQNNFHNYGLWNEGGLTTLSNPWSGLSQWAHQSTFTVRPEYPIQIRSDQCDWGLKNTLIAGIAISDRDQITSGSFDVTDQPILVFRDKATGDQIGVWLVVDSDPLTPDFPRQGNRWRLEVRRGATVLFTSGNVLPWSFGGADAGLDDVPAEYRHNEYATSVGFGGPFGSAWRFVEFKAVIDPVNGSYELRVDGIALVVEAGPVNTANQGTPGADQLKWSSAARTVNRTVVTPVSEVYLCDNAGAQNNNFLGRIQVHEKDPLAEGFQSEWTPDSGAAAHNTYVSHLDAVNDASWLESNNPGDTELFTISNLPRGMQDTLLAVQIILRGALSVGGDRDVSPVYREGGTNFVDAAFFRVTGPAFLSKPFTLEQNPDTLAAWTRASIEGQEFGFTLIA